MQCKCCGQEIISDSIYKNDVAKALMYLNKLAGTHFKPVEGNSKFLIARFKEGHTLKDVERVIDNKSAEWKDTDQAKYLRPATLFNATKFNQYVGQEKIPAQDSAPKDIYKPIYVHEEQDNTPIRTDDRTAFENLAAIKSLSKRY